MELGKELMKLEKLIASSGLLMEKYKKKVINFEKEKNELKANYNQVKPKTGAFKDQGSTFQRNDLALNAEPIFQSQVKRFQEAIQKILIEQRSFEKELDDMRLSKQMLANEVVVLQNSLTRLKYEFRTRSYADRDMQIIKREVQRVWHQKRLSDEQGKKKEIELAKMEERLKDMQEKLKETTENLNKTNMTLNVYRIILKEQHQQIHHLHEEIQKQSLIIGKQKQHLENCLNELESSKIDQKQTMLNLEIKLEEENHLKDILSQKRKENMGLKMDLFILQERLSESQHQEDLASTKLKWNEKYWNYYQSRLEDQDNELRNMRISQEYLWIKEQFLTLGSRNDLIICTMDRQEEEITHKIDSQLIKSLAQNHPSLMLESSFDNPLSTTSISSQQEYKTKIAGLELELQKRSALLDSKEKYNKELEYHISLLHQIFLGRFCKK